MPDVTMCISKSCNKEGCCYRAMKKIINSTNISEIEKGD
jgi:hypothetical protein